MSKVTQTLKAIKYRLHPQFKFVLDATPDYEHCIKSRTRSVTNMPEAYALNGWVIHPDRQPELHWYCKDEVIMSCPPWLSRDDVAECFPFIKTALTSGFSFQIPGNLLDNAPTGVIQLRAGVSGNEVVLWKNTNYGTPDKKKFAVALSNWQRSIGQSSAAHTQANRSFDELTQPVVLVLDTDRSVPQMCTNILHALEETRPPIPLCPSDFVTVQPLNDTSAASQRPILVHKPELIEYAFLLRYLIGGTVHYIANELQETPASLATVWNPAATNFQPPAPLPIESAGLSVIVPVYNALDVSLRCIERVIPSLQPNDECIIVSDASDNYVNSQLAALASTHAQVQFIERKENGGFIEACFTGYEASRIENDILLLNSDTVIGPGVLSALKEQMYERYDVAIGSPLSTGSPHFELRLPPGENYFAASKRLSQQGTGTTPTAITPEGQCLYVKRWALQKFGFLDRIYGRGFCEESDLAMRMFLRGADTVCLDKSLIYHERSASFGSYQRQLQLRRNRPIFEERWGRFYDLAFAAFRSRNPLAAVRSEWQSNSPSKPLPTLEVAFVLPSLITAGGHLSVIQHVNTMILRGHNAGIICFSAPETDALGLLTEPIVLSESQLQEEEKFPTNLVATMWTSANAVAAIAKKHTSVSGWYYVQDYEPWFYERSDQQNERSAAQKSYELGLRMVAKTTFLCNLVEEKHGYDVDKVCPGIARTIFYPGSQQTYTGTPRLAALYRPDKPRRGTALLLEVLEELLTRNTNVQVYLFGSSDISPCSPTLRKKIHFLGSIPSSRVAELYRHSDVVCDLSLWHGFGRMGIEAMACGAVPVLSESGGVNEYARHDENAVIVPDNPEAIAVALNAVLHDDVYRHRLRTNGLELFPWSEEQATTDWLQLLNSKASKEQAA